MTAHTRQTYMLPGSYRPTTVIVPSIYQSQGGRRNKQREDRRGTHGSRYSRAIRPSRPPIDSAVWSFGVFPSFLVTGLPGFTLSSSISFHFLGFVLYIIHFHILIIFSLCIINLSVSCLLWERIKVKHKSDLRLFYSVEQRHLELKHSLWCHSTKHDITQNMTWYCHDPADKIRWKTWAAGPWHNICKKKNPLLYRCLKCSARTSKGGVFKACDKLNLIHKIFYITLQKCHLRLLLHFIAEELSKSTKTSF